MLSKHVIVLCFLTILPFTPGNPTPVRPIDPNIRGNSFGLENFLYQPYENTEAQNIVRVVKTKRIRPVPTSRPNLIESSYSERSHAYALNENLNVQRYESSRIKPVTSQTPQEFPKRRIAEPTAESNRIKENFVIKPETYVLPTKEPEISSEQATERIRKRIMMRRRRKRPSNQLENNADIAGNTIVKPLRIPIYPQIAKTKIRPQLLDEESVSAFSIIEKTTPSIQTDRNIYQEATNLDYERSTKIGKPLPTKLATPSPTKIYKSTTTTTAKPSTINLKTFLKQQTETLSLSELLQTQNLSLADLLRGNKDASAILRAKQSISSTTPVSNTNGRRKQFTKVESVVTEEPFVKKTEEFEVTTARLSYNGFQPKIPRTKTTAQSQLKVDDTSEKIDLQFSTQYNTKQPIETAYTESPPENQPQNRLNELRLKLRNFQKKNPLPTKIVETSEKSFPSESIEPISVDSKTTEMPQYKKNRVSYKSANNPELSLILPSKVKSETETPKRPDRLSNWNNRLPAIKRFGQDKTKEADEPPPKLLQVPILKEEENTNNKKIEVSETTEQVEIITEDKPRKPEPKDELIELLKFGPNADRLQKILHSRNMTIQELLDNREKPPLQTDISTLFSQHKPMTEATVFESTDLEAGETDDQSFEELEAEESAPVTERVMPSREPKQYEVPITQKEDSELSLKPDDLATDTSNVEDAALWNLAEKTLYYGSSYGYGSFSSEKPKVVKPNELSESDIILLETFRRSQETNRKFKLDFSDFVRQEEQPQTDDIEKSYIPPAVKSAIIASGVVMGIALFVFIAIFAACGWKQRQIRLKGTSSTLGRGHKSKRAITPVSFKDTHSYKKTIDFDDETSESGTSNTSSYLWSTLKNTFTSRASTLKSRMEKEEKLREDKVTLRRNESRRKESKTDDRLPTDESYTIKKIDRDRNVINTSFNFKRTSSNNNINHFNECVHGY